MKKFFTLCICIVAVITTSAQEFTKVTEINGDTYPLYKKFNYNERPLMYDQKWISSEGNESVYEIAIYDYDFNLVKTLNIQGHLKDLEYENFDTPIPTQFISVTQTLFNDDEKFEYIIEDYDKPAILYSEDGTILYTFPYDTYIDHSIKTINGKNYIVLKNYVGEEFEGYYVHSFYLIDKQTTSIKKVAEMKMPYITAIDGHVKVQLRKESNGNSKVTITTINGQLTKQIEIPAGVKNLDIETTDMQQGIYNFTIIEEGKILGSGKFVVK